MSLVLTVVAVVAAAALVLALVMAAVVASLSGLVRKRWPNPGQLLVIWLGTAGAIWLAGLVVAPLLVPTARHLLKLHKLEGIVCDSERPPGYTLVSCSASYGLTSNGNHCDWSVTPVFIGSAQSELANYYKNLHLPSRFPDPTDDHQTLFVSTSYNASANRTTVGLLWAGGPGSAGMDFNCN
jgi:hypothetical protein